jgi:GntR family transcriptional regulator/MocR family aminotransferase
VAVNWAAFGVDLHLDLDSATGRRVALERALREAIRSGRLAPDTRLPATRALAAELNLARNTVSAAYDQLVAEGFLSARTGSGTVVAALPRPRSRAAVPPADAAPPRFDLRPGSPDVTSFPTAAWLRATRRALHAAPAAAFDYGDPRGRRELRVALADYLGRTRGVLADPERIVITSGSVQSVSLLAGVVHGAVAMEDPGLPFHRDVVRHARCRVVPLPVDDRGARTDLLQPRSLSERRPASDLGTGGLGAVRAALVTPAHQYPTGATMRPDRRHALTEWARDTGGLVVEDDYDGEFRYDRQPVGALQGMAPDHVAYLGTASKTLGPALRLGWMVLPERWLAPVLDAKLHTDLHTATIGQLALADMVTTHAYDRHVRACRLRYRRRLDLLLRRLAGLDLAVHGIAAGLHVCVDLGGPRGREDEVLRRAEALGLAVGDLRGHWHDPDAEHPPGVIVGFGTPGESAYPGAIDALARALSHPGQP